MSKFNDFMYAVRRAEGFIESAASCIGDDNLDEYLIECGYDMDCTGENIVLQYLENYYKG